MEVKMKNEFSIDNQNAQQIAQTPVNQPLQIPQIPKVNYWIIFTLVFAVLCFILAGIYAFRIQPDANSFPKLTTSPSLTPTLTPTPANTPITTESREWSSAQSWSTNTYTKTLFEFLKTKLSENYIYTHFELINPKDAVTEPGTYREVKFRLHYGNELAFTGNASRAVDDPLFISGNAFILDNTVKQYSGPLKEEEIKVSKSQAYDLLKKNGITNIYVPGGRKIDTLELWIYDSYNNYDTNDTENLDQFYWYGGFKDEHPFTIYRVNAFDGSIQKEELKPDSPARIPPDRM